MYNYNSSHFNVNIWFNHVCKSRVWNYTQLIQYDTIPSGYTNIGLLAIYSFEMSIVGLNIVRMWQFIMFIGLLWYCYAKYNCIMPLYDSLIVKYIRCNVRIWCYTAQNCNIYNIYYVICSISLICRDAMIFHLNVPSWKCLFTLLFVAPKSKLSLDMAPYKCILLLSL